MKPMLLPKDNPDTSKLEYPLAATIKLDGIRCLVTSEGKAVTRSLKPIPNDYIRETLSRHTYRGFDGEIIVGMFNAPDVYRQTASAVMSKEGEPEFKFWVFDDFLAEGTYQYRQTELQYYLEDMDGEPVYYLPSVICDNEKDLLDYENRCIEQGFEGVVIRNLQGLYKQGRCTMKEGNAYKLKRYTDGEALVIGMVPEMHNANMAVVNELGHIERSIHKVNMIPKDSMGALIVRDIESNVEFNIGTGFTAEDRKWWFREWMAQPWVVKYKSFPVGVKEKPRHPVYMGIRDARDMS